ncbi:MAG: hypothetical protein VR69_12950 [Peptococcaceae bacterium BRH_c4b]|nr:MAG: hypothetical protein VR69_12950 [Peptococcaceae bacterium BRH_c4b]
MGERGRIDRSISSLRTLRFPDDEDIFWFRDDLHQPYPISPFGMTTVQKHHAWSYHHASNKVMLPGSKGAHVKIYKGRVYLGFAVIRDVDEIKSREQEFVKNLEHCIDHWDEFYAGYINEVKEELNIVDAINPDMLKIAQLLEYIKWANEMNRRNWEIHFTTMYMADAIYFTFEDFCKKNGLEEKEFTVMLRGAYDTMATKTDREMIRLAQLAEKLGIGDKFLEDVQALIVGLKSTDEGNQWYARLEEFLQFYGNRITAGHLDVIYPTWKEDSAPVLETMGGYIRKLRDGWDFDETRAKLLRERDEAIRDFRDSLFEEEQKTFDRLLKAAEGVYFFQEDHGFYIDAGSTARLRYAGLACGRRLQQFGLLENAEDVFFLTYSELIEILSDLAREKDVAIYHHSRLVPSLVKERTEDWEKVKEEEAPLTAGAVPDVMSDPIGVKVFGIIDDIIHPKGEQVKSLRLEGFQGAPGVVEGRARVITHFDGFAKVEPGEILVCPYTSTAWTPLFPKIAGVVTDTGGMLTHAAIAAREYRIPAVVGCWNATNSIDNGDLIRVDGDNGVVEILQKSVVE